MVAATFDIKANDRTKAAFNSVTKKLKRIGKIAAKSTIALAAVSGTALTGLALSSARSANILAKHADKIGITTEKLASLQYMTEQYTNAGLGAMAEALTKAEKRLGEFSRTGGGAASTWLKSLNLDVAELKTLSPDQLFQTYAESIRGLSSRGEQLAAISALMGDESRSLINIIDAGPEAFRNAEIEARAFGLTLSRVDAAKIEAAGDAIDKVQQVFKGIGNKLAVKFSVYIEEIANRFNDAAFASNGFAEVVESGMKKAILSVAYLGDVIQGLSIAWKVVEIATKSFEVVLLNSLNLLQTGIIEIVNLMPGIDIEPIKVLSEATRKANIEFKDTSQTLVDLISQPMPSEKIEAFFKTIEEKATLAGEKVAEITRGRTGRDSDSVSAFSEQLAKKFEALELSILTEDERLMLANESRQLIVNEAFENELINEERRNEMLQNLELNHQAKLGSLEAQGMIAREKFRKKSALMKNKQVFGEIAQLTAGVAQSNKTLFNINKIAGISNAVIDAYTGISRTLSSYPYPLNLGMAAAHGLAAFAQIKAISSTSFGSGGGAPSIAGGGGGAPTDVNVIPSGNNQQNNNAAETKTSETIIIQGIDPDKMFDAQQLRDLVERVAETTGGSVSFN